MKIPELIKSPFLLLLLALIAVSFWVPFNEFGEGNLFASTWVCIKGGSIRCIIFAVLFLALLVYSLLAFIRGVLNLRKDNKGGSKYIK